MTDDRIRVLWWSHRTIGIPGGLKRVINGRQWIYSRRANKVNATLRRGGNFRFGNFSCEFARNKMLELLFANSPGTQKTRFGCAVHVRVDSWKRRLYCDSPIDSFASVLSVEMRQSPLWVRGQWSEVSRSLCTWIIKAAFEHRCATECELTLFCTPGSTTDNFLWIPDINPPMTSHGQNSPSNWSCFVQFQFEWLWGVFYCWGCTGNANRGQLFDGEKGRERKAGEGVELLAVIVLQVVELKEAN